MHIVSDIIEFTSKNMPNFNSVSISGYHIQEAGADAALELGYTIADGLEYVRAALSRGLKVDEFAGRLSFFFGIGMNFFAEIAKLRAARILWYEYMQQFSPKDPRSSVLRTHCQTSGYSLSALQPHNNIIRTTIEALAATLGGTQSLHTNAFDEALALPSEFAAQLARNTQLILREETDLTSTVDPFGGSYFMESLTIDIAEKAREVIREVEELGGMTQAISNGLPKMRIEQAAASKQGRLDNTQDVVVGVNKYKGNHDTSEEKVDLRTIDNNAVREEQIKRLKKIKRDRNTKEVNRLLAQITKLAESRSSGLLELVVQAVEKRATVGEISLSIENAFGRYEGSINTVSDVYAKNMEGNLDFQKVIKEVETFHNKHGRRPRILVAKLGQDGHDRGAHAVASGLADLGFDVDVGPLFQTPKEVANQAIENDVHFVGISSQAGGHTTLIPELIDELKALKANSIHVVVGGIIPPEDEASLRKVGVKAVMTPGTPITESAMVMLKFIIASGDK